MAESKGTPALRALVRLEIRRILPGLGRALVMGGVVTGVLVVSGAFTFPRLAFILAVVGALPVMAFPMNALRDKLDGGLEFLRVLPVSPGTLAIGRLLALIGVAIPGALIATAAALLALHDALPGVVGPQVAVGIFFAAMLLIVGGSFLATALVLRFEVQQANYAALAFLGSLMVLGQLGERFLPDPLGTFMALAGHAWFLPALWTGGLVAVGVAAWFAYSLACSGIERFTPARDRLTW